MKAKQAPNADRLAQELYAAFHTAPEFKGYDINVTARNGHVNLQGIVDVKADADRAIAFAKNFPGVVSVENNLTVSTDGAVDDGDVYLEVAQELAADPRINAEKFHFTVENRIVSLHGRTASAAEREAAAQAAAKARGVRSVNNQIKVGDKEPDLDDIRLW